MHLVNAVSAILQMDTDKITKALRTLWWESMLPHDVDYRGDAARFNCPYLVTDPWLLNSETERYRFRQTNELIRKKFGHSHRLLEIGCGDGLQSREQVCDQLSGIDVSERAIGRARRRCPVATFSVSDMYALPQPPTSQFDLVAFTPSETQKRLCRIIF
jgi:Methyltransferase domain